VNSSNLHFFKTKLQKITKTCAHQADNRIQSQSAKKTAAIFRKSPPTHVTDAAIVPRGTISEVAVGAQPLAIISKLFHVEQF
jgi:hypothetical protein